MSKLVEKTTNALVNDNTILYPTDTVWGLGCDATNVTAVAKIYQIKKRAESKSLIILVDSFEMLQEYVDNIPEKVIEILNNAEKPTTIIYKNPIGLAPNVIASDNTVAIRIVQNEFCQQLIKEFGKPIVSTSANISGDTTPMSFKEIKPTILDAVDYVVNLQQESVATQSSRILKILENGTIQVLRD